MSKIHQFSRSYEVFDPYNAEHRKIFHEVLKYQTWGRSPIRFWLDGTEDSLMEQCTRKMAKYYMIQEFGPLAAEDARFGESKIRVRADPHAHALAQSRKVNAL